MWNKIWQAPIAYRVLKVTFMAVVVGSVLFWVWITVQDFRLDRISSQSRQWDEKTLDTIHGVATLKTRCSDSRLYYLLTIRGNNKWGKLKGALSQIKQLTLKFIDRDGFKLLEVPIKHEDLSIVMGDDGHPTAFEANSSTSCDQRAFARADKWRIGLR